MNAPAAFPQVRSRTPVIRFAIRDLRGGLGGLRIFLLCIALGVAAIVGVESLAGALDDGLGREGRVILGGDASFSLIHRRLSAAEQQFLESYGSLSTVATMRAMARAESDDAALVELKAVEPSWPRIGAAVLAPSMPLDEALSEKDGAFGAAAEEALLARLNLKLGDVIRIGEAKFAISDRTDQRTGSLGDRRRSRSPRPHFAGGARRHGAGPTGIPCSLDDPRHHGRGGRRAG